MIPLKGFLLGLGFAFVGSLIYAGFLMRSIFASAPQGQQIGIDMVSLFKYSVLSSPAYWVFVSVLFIAGIVVMHYIQRPTLP
jgi:hypothetical protein